MPELSGWKNTLIIQRDPYYGCIPAGYEWLLKFSNVKGINFENFQEEFNLKALSQGENNFNTIAKAIKNKYPHIDICRKSFDKGSNKVKFIENLIKKNIPVLISLKNIQQSGWHIMPVIYIDDEKLKLISNVDQTSTPHICIIEKEKIIQYHDNYPGGKDIAWFKFSKK